MKEVKVKTEPKELSLFNGGFPVPSPVEGKWKKQLKTLGQNAGVDRCSVQNVLSESESLSLSSEDNLSDRKRRKKIISDLSFV